MHPFIQRLAATFFIISLVTALVSCGGGGGGSTDADQVQGKGTVGILLTDKPADPAMFDAIIASIVKVELMGSEENGRVTIYSAPPIKEYDLLRLRNESIPLAFMDNVPVGKYCKIRLTLTDLELVLADNTPYNFIDNETYHPKLPGNGKLDLVVRDCFYVVRDEVITLQLDFDMGKSIHIVGNKKGYNFRPVIFVDVINQDFDSKLVRLNGEISSVNPDGQTLLLCHALPSQHMDNLGCVNVHFGKNSAFFDNIKYEGTPRAISELLSDNKLGMQVTIVGWLKSWNKADYDDDKSAEYHPLLKLEALVAELGEFLTVEGTVAADAVPTGFPMTVSSGGPVTIDSTLKVVYQLGSAGINGTRIVSKSGVLLKPGDAKQFLPVQVDGILDLIEGIDPMLRAALVILDKGALGVEQVTGEILEVYTNSLLLNPDVGTVCGVAGPVTVGLSNDLEILTVTITDDSAEIVPGGILKAGQTVGMNGTCAGIDYQTDNAVIVDDKRPE
jgi:hypothetical protein